MKNVRSIFTNSGSPLFLTLALKLIILKFSEDIKKHTKLFLKYYSNGTLPFLVSDILENDIDYLKKIKNKHAKKMLFCSVYISNLKQDNQGLVLNHRQAMRRAAQKIRKTIDSKYRVHPKFEKWEMDIFN